MTIRSEQDMCALAASLRLAGELLEATGSQALAKTSSWTPGPRSPNLDPSTRGHRWEEIQHPDGSLEVVPIPSDRVGEAAINDGADPGRYHARLRAALSFVESSVEEIILIVRLACPNPAALSLKVEELTTAQVAAQGWCVSCWRDGCYHEPVAMRPGGKRKYREFCDWCGSWAGEHKDANGNRQLPPLKLVEYRRRGIRINDQVIAEVLATDAREKAEAKKDRKEKARKKKRAA